MKKREKWVVVRDTTGGGNRIYHRFWRFTSRSGLSCPRADRKELPIVPALMRLLIRYRGNANPWRVSYPRIRACVWLLRNTSLCSFLPFPMYPAATLCHFCILAVATLQSLSLLPPWGCSSGAAAWRRASRSNVRIQFFFEGRTSESRRWPHVHPSPAVKLVIEFFFLFGRGDEFSEWRRYSFILFHNPVL
jgi:hypothetical protein